MWSSRLVPLLQKEDSRAERGLKKGEKDNEEYAIIFHAEAA